MLFLNYNLKQKKEKPSIWVLNAKTLSVFFHRFTLSHLFNGIPSAGSFLYHRRFIKNILLSATVIFWALPEVPEVGLEWRGIWN